MIGDTPHDIHCANAIGALTIAVATGGYTAEELRGLQDAVPAEPIEAVQAVMAEEFGKPVDEVFACWFFAGWLEVGRGRIQPFLWWPPVGG